MMGFDDFKAFVNERGRVDGDFGAHVPGGVRERLGGGYLLEVGTRAAVKGAAGAG